MAQGTFQGGTCNPGPAGIDAQGLHPAQQQQAPGPQQTGIIRGPDHGVQTVEQGAPVVGIGPADTGETADDEQHDHEKGPAVAGPLQGLVVSSQGQPGYSLGLGRKKNMPDHT